jgi:hypothetical protein
MRYIVFLVAAVLSCSAHAQKVSEMKVVATSGNWELRKGIDSFSDKNSCILLLRGQSDVQASNTGMAIGRGRARGGLEGYNLRINDNPPLGLKRASDIEKRLSSIIIEGSLFETVKGAQRLRVDATGILSGSGFHLSGSGFQLDINMNGFNEMLARWEKEACPKN